MITLTTARSFVAGWFAWTLGEYVLHRFAMHAMKGRGIASREHLEPPRRPRLDPREVGAVVGRRARRRHRPRPASSIPALGVGWVVGYGFYDLQHYRAHRRAPRTRYQRWLRRHHFHHHFGHPMANHGVTWPLWDHVFGTYEAPGADPGAPPHGDGVAGRRRRRGAARARRRLRGRRARRRNAAS